MELKGCTPQVDHGSLGPGPTNGESLPTGEFDVVAADVRYFEDFSGTYAHPSVEGDYPGVVMIHEWWGLNQNIKDMASTLASQGYHVLAVDLHGTVATTPEQARALTGSLDQQKALANMNAALAFLKSKGATKTASLGWCFGGGQSLQLALNEPLDATVIYYGRLETNETMLSAITWPVLGIFGATDQSIPVATVNEFDAALTALGREHEINIYPGVGHAFANPSGANYAPNETKDAWDKTLAFLDKHLK